MLPRVILSADALIIDPSGIVVVVAHE